MDTEKSPYLNAREACMYLRVHIRTLYQIVKSGELRSATIAGRLLFRPEWLDAWVESQATQTVDRRAE